MLDLFNIIKGRVISQGTKISDNIWKLESCLFEIKESEEIIYVPELIKITFNVIDGVLTILEGSEDSLKFLATSI